MAKLSAVLAQVDNLVEAVELWHDDGIDWESVALVARSRWVWGAAAVGVRDGVVHRKGITPASEGEIVHRNDMHDERNLLFVAATRPRERLQVSCHSEPSPFLTVGRA